MAAPTIKIFKIDPNKANQTFNLSGTYVGIVPLTRTDNNSTSINFPPLNYNLVWNVSHPGLTPGPHTITVTDPIFGI